MVAALAVAMGVYLTITPPPGTPTKPSAASLATGRMLDRKLPPIAWVKTPLKTALHEIGRGATVAIEYDFEAFRAGGIDPAELLVSARLRDVRASKALQVALDQHRLHYFVDDGSITVTTADGDAKRAKTWVYNVSDFTVEEPRTPKEESELNREIVRLFTQTVDPESWVEAGGKVGSIQLENGLMTVRQTPENLWLIGGLLGQLREGNEPQRLRRRVQEDAR